MGGGGWWNWEDGGDEGVIRAVSFGAGRLAGADGWWNAGADGSGRVVWEGGRAIRVGLAGG